MSAIHEKLPKLFWVQLLLVAIVAALYLYYHFTSSDKKHAEAATEANPKAVAAAKHLKPVGKVALTSSTAKSTNKARSGKKVYDSACFACHSSGVANAPKPDDKAAWEPRITQGLDVLIKTAINGKGAMPPRGGNPSISDEEIKNAILYMTTQAGFHLASAPTEKGASTGDSTSSTDNTHNTDTKPVKVSQQDTQNTQTASVASTTLVEPPQPAAAPIPPTPPSPPTEAEAATTRPEPVMEKVAEASTAATPAASNEATLKLGEKTYKKTCFACHATGVANAPKLEDKANWAPRIASGKETLYHSALNGKGVMPPKGGNMGLADDVVKAAVDYMVNQAQ